MFKLRSVVKHDFEWTLISAYPCVFKHLTNPVRLFIYVFIITYYYLTKVERLYLKNIKTAYGRVNHHHAGQTIILPNDSSAWLLFYF